MNDWKRAVEDQIRAAIEAGEFDDLAGKGKPLPLDENPFASPDTWMAHRILRSNGFSLPWIEERREIQTELETAQLKLIRAYLWYQDTLSNGETARAEEGWKRARNNFREQATKLNQRTRNYNLKAPSPDFHLPLLNMEMEIASVSQRMTGNTTDPR